MAFQTGSASSVDDLLNTIRLFAVANGWTQNGYAADGDGYRLHLQKAGMYVNMRSGGVVGYGYVSGTASASWPAIRLYGSTGYNAGAAWDAQPGRAAAGAGSNDMGFGPMTYWLFGISDAIYCVAEVAAGIFKHLAFGVINKICAFTGGGFAAAVNWSSRVAAGDAVIHTSDNSNHSVLFDSANYSAVLATQLRADIDGNSDYWLAFQRGGVAGAARSIVRNVPGYPPSINLWQFHRSPSDLNGQNVLQHMYCFAWRPGNKWSLLGWPPGIRLVNMSTLSPKQEISIGPDTWVVFPVIQKNGANLTPNSGVLGYAYRQAP